MSNILDLNLQLKKIKSDMGYNYYFELCCPTIIDIYNECPSDSTGIVIKKCFKINDTIFHSKSLNIEYSNLTTGVSLPEKYDFETDGNSITILTDRILKNNKLCIKKFELKVIPSCLNTNKTINERAPDNDNDNDNDNNISLSNTVVSGSGSGIKETDIRSRLVKLFDELGIESNNIIKNNSSGSFERLYIKIKELKNSDKTKEKQKNEVEQEILEQINSGKLKQAPKQVRCYDLPFLDDEGKIDDPVKLVIDDDIFGVELLKTDGQWDWVAKTIEGEGLGISAGPDGTVYVTGYIDNEDVKFHNGGDSTAINGLVTGFDADNIGNDEVFVAKINSNGKWEWVARAGGGSKDEGFGISTGPSGDVFVTGMIHNNNNIKFYDGGDSTPSTITTGFNPDNSGDEVFVAKIDKDGEWQWVARAGGADSGDVGRGISAGPNGDVFVIGNLNNENKIKFYDGGKSTKREGFVTGFDEIGGDGKVFVAKIDNNGVWQWVARAGAAYENEGYSISAGLDGDVFITGYLNNEDYYNVTFYDGNNSTYRNDLITGFVGDGDYDVFVAKIIDNSSSISGVINNNIKKDELVSVCFPDNNIEYNSMYKSGKKYYKNGTNITENYLGSIYYHGISIEDGQIILYNKNN